MSFKNAKVVSVGVNPANYHNQEAKRGSKEFAVSPSSLREFWKCPRRWMDGYESPDSDAKDFGSLLDCRLLTPGEFDARYAIRPSTYKDSKTGEDKPFNLNSNVCKEWVKERGDREIVSSAQVASCNEAASRLMKDEIIAAWFDACDKQVLVTGEWHDEKTKMVVPVRCLMDFVPRVGTEFEKCLGDFKTTRNAGLQAWSRWCFQAGYHIQGAFDTDLFVAATGEDRMTWCFIVQESFAPWQTGKRMLSQEHGLDLGRLEYGRMLALYSQCLSTSCWPEYDDTDEAVQGWSLVTAEPWMENRMMFEPKTTIESESEDPVCLQ
jgi:hypothetical protein